MTREEIYRKFGSILLEAVVLVIKDEINIIRQIANLPERNNQQLIDAIDQKYKSLDKYNWMKELE